MDASQRRYGEAGAKRTYETLRFLWKAPMDSASTPEASVREQWGVFKKVMAETVPAL